MKKLFLKTKFNGMFPVEDIQRISRIYEDDSHETFELHINFYAYTVSCLIEEGLSDRLEDSDINEIINNHIVELDFHSNYFNVEPK